MKTVIHWFRRDLRLTDNTALHAASRDAEIVVPVYIVSEWKHEHRWTGPARQEFLCGCLESLSKNLHHIGSRLIIRHGQAFNVLQQLVTETGASAVYFNRDPDPFGRGVEQQLEKLPCAVRSFKDIALHERDEVLTTNGDPYRVFTPYSKAWLKLEKPQVQPAVKHLKSPAHLPSDPLPALATWGLTSTARVPEAGEKAARQRMDQFFRQRILYYGTTRDLPALPGTSHLSIDLRHGTISPRELFTKANALLSDANAAERKNIQTFINELAWREFYLQVLWHWPEILDEEFNPKYRGLKWHRSQEKFARWCAGETGFPIVDAGLRQLNATGWMHNRLRMITAMFLTKDLHLDWRLGERYFMQRLVDGEIASNNGGWQWSAGTGADAAPYFRIQNPWSQTARYDVDAEYIKHWVPELRDVESGKLAKAPAPGIRFAKGYPEPMVDHAKERDVCLEMFRETAS